MATRETQDTLSEQLARLADLAQKKAVERALKRLKAQRTPLRGESNSRVVRSR